MPKSAPYVVTVALTSTELWLTSPKRASPAKAMATFFAHSCWQEALQHGRGVPCTPATVLSPKFCENLSVPRTGPPLASPSLRPSCEPAREQRQGGLEGLWSRVCIRSLLTPWFADTPSVILITPRASISVGGGPTDLGKSK